MEKAGHIKAKKRAHDHQEYLNDRQEVGTDKICIECFKFYRMCPSALQAELF